MNIKQLLNQGTEILKDNKQENPVMHARLLLEFSLEKNREYLIINDQEEVEKAKEIYYIDNIKRLSEGMPIQYITNHQEFMKLDFYVDENVLIPRADTEILVEEVIKNINSSKKENLKVLDMCTGSGAIAVSIAKYTENAKVYAVDLSEKALKIAEKNAIKNKVENKCQFIKSNMFENVVGDFDIIISNPPYIKSDVIKELDRNVQKEPIMALDGGQDGLYFYKILAEKSYKFLREDGMLFLEIGYDQKEAVKNLLEETNKYENIYLKKDLSQNDRVIVATKRKD